MAKTKHSPDDLLSTAQAAAELGIKQPRLNVLLNSGRLAAMRVGKVWIIRRGDLDAVRDRRTGRPRKKSEEKKPEQKKKPA
jgi:excisionase family DNA binding protein